MTRLKLADIAHKTIPELPYGRQRLVELAITLGLKPEVLLLDEPAAGVPSAESHIILDAIDALPKSIGVLIIDHDMDLVFRFAKKITVLVRGAVFAEGTPKEIGANPDVRAVYLGQAAPWLARVELNGVSAGYGETVVLEDINLALAPGESISVIGRNGVGKTTLLATIMGHTTLHKGEVLLAGRSLNRVPVYRRARRRHRLRAAGARDFSLAQRAGEPRGRRAARPLDQGAGVRAVPEPARSGSTTAATSSPAASSRCCRSRARC